MNRISARHIAPAIAAATFIFLRAAIGADMQNHMDAAAIEATATRWAQAFDRGDVEAIVSMYTEDAQLLPDGGPVIVGRAAIRKFFLTMKQEQPGRTIRFSRFEFYGTEPVVTERSHMEIRDGAGKLQLVGKQVLIRVKQQGQWKIHRDIWNSDGSVKTE